MADRSQQTGYGAAHQSATRAISNSRARLDTGSRVLATVLKTPDEEVDGYLRVLAEMAETSGGGITDPPQTVGDCPDWEDNRILDLAAAVGAFLIVSADTDLTSMSPGEAAPSSSQHSSCHWSTVPGGHVGYSAEQCRLRLVRVRPG